MYNRKKYLEFLVSLILFGSSVFVIFYSVVQFLFFTYFNQWSSMRLLPSFLISDGKQIYSSLSEGLYAVTLYGPSYPFFYLPATIIKDPVSTVLVGNIISFILVVTPMIFLLHKASNNQNGKKYTIFAVLIFFLFVLRYLSMPEVLYAIGADSPCISMCLFSLLLIYLCINNINGNNLFYIFFSSLFIILAIFSKHIAIFFIIALLLILFLIKKHKEIKYFLFFSLLNFVILLFIFGYLYGFSELKLNYINIPSKHHLFKLGTDLDFSYFINNSLKFEQTLTEKISILFSNLKTFFFSFLSLNLLLIAYMARWFLKNKYKKNFYGLCDYLAICSIFMIPTSVLGWSKVGGGGNTLSYFTVLTSLFASALLIKLLRQSFSKNLVNIILSALLIFGFSSYYYKTNFVDHEYKLVLSILSGEQKSNRRVVYDIYNKEPNKIYFPNYGLEQYLATKKLLPLADVLQSFRLARYNIEDDVIIEHFKDLDYIVIGVAEPGYETIKHYLQEINELEDIKLVDQRR